MRLIVPDMNVERHVQAMFRILRRSTWRELLDALDVKATTFSALGILGNSTDRVVWRLDWQMVHRKFGLPELALLIEDLQQLFGKSEPFTPWRLVRAEPNLQDFACMIEPPSLDERIEAQGAVFTLCSDKRRSFADFLTDHGLVSALTRFLIPAVEVARLRDQLDLVGIDERFIFPDLDGVAARIRRYYS